VQLTLFGNLLHSIIRCGVTSPFVLSLVSFLQLGFWLQSVSSFSLNNLTSSQAITRKDSQSNIIDLLTREAMPRSVLPSALRVLPLLLGVSLAVGESSQQQQLQLISPPQLNGAKFRVTVVKDPGFVEVIGSSSGDDDGRELEFSGYLVQVMKTMADPTRANMTLEFVTPSGMTSKCHAPGCGAPPAGDDDGANASLHQELPYSTECYSNYGCATTDVTDFPHTNYTTDMYLGLFYVTPARQLQNQFSIPLYPPTTGTLTMVGTATGIRDIEDLVQQQLAGIQGPACVRADTAYPAFLQESFPQLQMVDCLGTEEGTKQCLRDGTCDVAIVDHPVATHFVLSQSLQGACTINDKVGVRACLPASTKSFRFVVCIVESYVAATDS
jgi:hypothetical protein